MDKIFNNLQYFNEIFGTEKQCLDYLYRLRWPNGYRCPRCHHNEAWQIKEWKYKCRKCGYQATVTAGTIFQDSHLPLTVWFRAIWHIISNEPCTDAVELQSYLGLGSYRTAWAVLLKVRKAMAPPKLKGTVAIDTASLPPSRVGKQNNLCIAVECQIEEKSIVGLGQIRVGLACHDLQTFLQNNVTTGSAIISAYDKQTFSCIKPAYRPIVMQRRHSPFGDMLHPVYIVTTRLLKKNLLGTHQQLCSGKHLDCYLNECCFKYNHRDIIGKQKLFDKLLRMAVNTQPLPHKHLIEQK